MTNNTLVIPIDDRHRIFADSLGWSIQQRRKRKGQIVWESFLWFSTLDGTVNALAQLGLRTSGAMTLAEALAAQKNIFCSLSQALAPHYEVVPVSDSDIKEDAA